MGKYCTKDFQSFEKSIIKMPAFAGILYSSPFQEAHHAIPTKEDRVGSTVP